MYAAIDAGGRNTTSWATSIGRSGKKLEELSALISEQLKTSRVVLAIEAPLWIPLRRSHATMSSARTGERISWASRVGGGVLASGLANLAVVLQNTKLKAVTFDDTDAVGHLVILEAYRLSAGDDDNYVASEIVAALSERWPNHFKDRVRPGPDEEILNLAASLALALNLPVEIAYLQKETRVIDSTCLD